MKPSACWRPINTTSTCNFLYSLQFKVRTQINVSHVVLIVFGEYIIKWIEL